MAHSLSSTQYLHGYFIQSTRKYWLVWYRRSPDDGSRCGHTCDGCKPQHRSLIKGCHIKAMRVETWLLLVISSLAICAWLALLGRLWILRNVFEIAARAPNLVIAQQTASVILVISVLVHWALLWEGQGGLNCNIKSPISYSYYPTGVFPIVIRGYRLVIVYNREIRHLSKYVKRGPVFLFWSLLTLIFAAHGTYRTVTKRLGARVNLHECLYFDDTASNLLCVIASWPILFGGKNIMQVQDAFKVGQELVSVTFCVTVIAGSQTFVNGLIMFGAEPEMRSLEYYSEVCVIIFGVMGGINSLAIPLSRYDRWGRKGGGVVPVENFSSIGSGDDSRGVLFFAREGGIIRDNFANFAQENLCIESWDFIMAAVGYEAVVDKDKQYERFVEILVEYLEPRSPSEVNISSSMRKRIAKFKEKEVFFGLDDNGRASILKEPLDEIVRMLEQNLLTKFRQRCAERTRAEHMEMESVLGS